MTHLGSKDIVRYMGADPTKMHVIYEAYKENCRVLRKEETAKVRKNILFLKGLYYLSGACIILKISGIY
jgi:hypothetical protein